ncbi:uncharacterized protein PHALS_04456 [Plasmopara halstedii]|uniref:Uncharacterized protein n=1 Tax=Plasmopara halstedii TaxID=4781 RepID=A0A0P1A9V7_PLAHL|nr:uncharacterized protein PHALS_04456 [Plasmopara halstedii]CEG36990.1 hypothetical protein PHALS_04456 [Plasmopara halstedii]|eukprot:XP_024573359.1 hypothetical protein PHALS_04456 [Plasmopara halstedii]
MLSARYGASTMIQGVSTVDDAAQLYTLVNGMNGEEDGDVRLEAMPAVDDLLELDEMSPEEFGSALKAGNLAKAVIVRQDEEINSPSLLDEAVLEGCVVETLASCPLDDYLDYRIGRYTCVSILPRLTN